MSVRTLARTTLLGTVAAAGLAVSAHATTFDLAGSLNAVPTFSITSAGQTATFTSPAGNLFMVQASGGLLTFPVALLDSNFFGTDPLTISFSQPVTGAINIPFAIQDAFGPSTDALTVTTNTGSTFTFGTVNDNLGLQEPEGLVKIQPTSAITSLTLTSPIAFAIGNVSVPEPVSLSLLGAGLVGFAAMRRRA